MFDFDVLEQFHLFIKAINQNQNGILHLILSHVTFLVQTGCVGRYYFEVTIRLVFLKHELLKLID